MLFEAIIRSLETVSDVIEFGPVKAAKINTSFCPEAERDTIRILSDLEKENYASTRPHTEPSVIPSKREPVSGMKSLFETIVATKAEQSEDESVLDQEEEVMIRKAVAEKGHY